jgi:hypothetical protein
MRRNWLLPLLIALALLGAAPAGAAAQVTPAPPADTAAAPPPADTLAARAAPADSLQPSARGALLRSLVLPGWGQAYVGAPGRGAIYFGIEAASLWMVFKSRRELGAARRLEASLIDPNSTTTPPELPLAKARRQQVEDWITLSVFFLFFSGADAYVAAQLSDFSQHLGVLPGDDGSTQFQVSLPVGGGR